MIYPEQGKERNNFISFVEHALGILSKSDYLSFLSLFDNSRLTEQDLITFSDGSGYYIDYDLTTDGKINDLTIQIEFRKAGDGYIVLLDDLHTM